MKSLKILKEELKIGSSGYRELSSNEKKLITGGYYSTKEECESSCGHWFTAYGPKGKSSCYAFQGPNGPYYDCMDS